MNRLQKDWFSSFFSLRPLYQSEKLCLCFGAQYTNTNSNRTPKIPVGEKVCFMETFALFIRFGVLCVLQS